VARDGHLLYPAFPYTHYTRMTDADIDAAWHYLMSRTPVHAEPRANGLLFPLTWRPLLAFWNALYLEPGDGRVPARTGAISGTVARGRYLADTLGHCGSCHSGLTLAGGERRPPFGGGTIDGWTAPALTRLAQGPAPWTESELAEYLGTGLSRGHGAAKGPMRPVTERLAGVPREDVAALAAWLMSIQQPGAPAGAVPSVAAAHPSTAGKALFDGACAGCHAGAAPMMRLAGRPPLARSSAVLGEHPATFVQTVLQGIGWPADQHGRAGPYMPPFAAALTDAQIALIAGEVRAAAGLPPWPDTERESARLRKELPR
jgi:mono/diheme cytochrome c family protein